MGQKELIHAVVEASRADIWDLAKLEWDLIDIQLNDYSDGVEYCLCGHEIVELCFIKNRFTGRELMVGNVCVKKFLGIRSDKIFSAVKKIKKDITASVNPETLEYALQHNWISSDDFGFYVGIIRKRRLSTKQQKWKLDVNKRIIRAVERSSRRKATI